MLLGDEEKDEIYALKRVGWSNQNGRAKVSLELPEGLLAEREVKMWVVSDGYVGLEWRLDVRVGGEVQQVEGQWVEKDGSAQTDGRTGDGGW